jgi:diguanylate cyclase (GGDEF)-like protein/PAS domain S-box-containing protein
MPESNLSSALSVNHLLTACNQLGAYIFIKDRAFRYLYANQLVCELFDRSIDQILGHQDEEFFGDTAAALIDESDRLVLEYGETIDRIEHVILSRTGRALYFSTVKQPLRDEQGGIIGLIGVSTDITAHIETQHHLYEKEQFLSAILANLEACIYTKDKELRFRYLNAQTEQVFGLPASEVLGKSNSELLGPEQAEVFSASDSLVFERGEVVSCREVFKTEAKGDRYYWSIKAPMFDSDGNVEALIGLSSDITSQVALETELRLANAELNARIDEVEALRAELEESAIRDPLTQLFNRRYLDEFVKKEWARAERNKQPISVALLDLDFFKRVNDQFGHAAGDCVLEHFSQLLSSVARKTDIACRFGGEEFVLLMPGAPLEVAVARAEQLRRGFAELTTHFEGNAISTTVSVGVACYPRDANTFEQLIAIADKALYQAKHSGRNLVISSEQLACQ